MTSAQRPRTSWLCEQPGDQAVELFTAVSAREDFVHRRRETRRVAHRLGASCERLTPELAIRSETGELEQPGPHQARRAKQVEECVLREHRPTLSLPPFEHVVEHRRGHGDHDRARDRLVKSA
jgi:hypothetical protein